LVIFMVLILSGIAGIDGVPIAKSMLAMLTNLTCAAFKAVIEGTKILLAVYSRGIRCTVEHPEHDTKSSRRKRTSKSS
jgi:hypothetical protein